MHINSLTIDWNHTDSVYEVLFAHYRDKAVSIAKIGNTSLKGFLYAQVYESVEDNLFDIILNNSTISFEEQIKFIKNSITSLKEGGIMVIENAIYNETDYDNHLQDVLEYFIFTSFIASSNRKILALIKKNEVVFDEIYYIENNEDVAIAIKNNQFMSGFDHWLKHGKKEKRKPRSQCRYDLINHFISKRKYKNYLEIGVADCATFNRIKIEDKTGVDVVYCPCPILIMTSDEFFKINTKFFDIIFIDGLHLEKQVEKDIRNALKCLSPNGVIMLHDCLPPDEWHAREENDGGSWNGTTWKAVLKYFNKSNYECYIINTDWGCGVIDSSKNNSPKNIILPELIFDPWANYLKTNYAINEKEFFNRV
jgi:predicted O-methyltransferase YrrM